MKSEELQAAVSSLGKRGESLVVFAIRRDDVAFFVHPDLAPRDAIELIRGELPAILQHLIQKRKR